MITVQWA